MKCSSPGFSVPEPPGQTVVAVWGIGFNDGRDYTLAECRRLVEFLKNDPEAVVAL